MNRTGENRGASSCGCVSAGRVKGLVSIVVPIFNGETYMRESLDSILAQTYRNTEVLVMDDASTDGTARILRDYGDKVRVFRQPANKGIYGNANDGIALSRGEFIAVYHADDVYAAEIVEREVQFFETNPDAGAVFTNMHFIGPDGVEYGKLELPAGVRGGKPLEFATVFNALLTHMNAFLMCPTAMVRASVHNDVGVYKDADFRNTSDLEMWLRISKSYPVGVLEERLLLYRHYHESSSFKYHRLRTEPGRFFHIMDLYLARGGQSVASPQSLAAYEAHRAQDLLMTAVSNYILDQRPEALKLLRRVHPGKILASGMIQRGRMFVLYLMLNILARVPGVPAVAKAFRRRWHEKTVPVAKERPAVRSGFPGHVKAGGPLAMSLTGAKDTRR